MELRLSAEAFDTMRQDFDDVLMQTMDDMYERHTDHAAMTLKLDIRLEQITADDGRVATLPRFSYNVSSVMQVKTKTAGELDSNFEVACEDGRWIIRPYDSGQVSLFRAGTATIPFTFLLDCMGSPVEVEDADGTVMAVTEKAGSMIQLLTSEPPKDNPLYCSPGELRRHVGHTVELGMEPSTATRTMCIAFLDRDTGEVFHRVYAPEDYVPEEPED